MPVNVSHSSNPALKAQLAFKAGQGEYGKWKQQYEDRAEQQALSNAFKLSGEMRANQAPFTQAKLQQWSNQQKADIEVAQTKALVKWRSSPEYATMEASAKFEKTKAHDEAATIHISDQKSKLEPNVALGAKITYNDGSTFTGTNPEGQLDQKTAQGEADKIYRQARGIDPSRARTNIAQQFRPIPINADTFGLLNAETGEITMMPTERSGELKAIGLSADKAYASYIAAYNKASDEQEKAEMASLDEQAVQFKWSAKELREAKATARHEIYQRRNSQMKDQRFFSDQAADSKGYERIGGGSGPSRGGPRVIPDDGQMASPGEEGVGERQGAGGIDPYFGRNREEQAGIASGALVVGRGPIPEVGEGDERRGEVPPSIVQAENEAAKADITTLTTGLGGLGELILGIQDIVGTDRPEEGWDPSMSKDQLTDSLLSAVHMKRSLLSIKQFRLNAAGDAGIKPHSVLFGVQRQLTRINAEIDTEIGKIIPLLKSAEGEHSPEELKEKVLALGRKYSDPVNGWNAQILDAWVPAELHLAEAMGNMNAVQAASMGGLLPKIFRPSMLPNAMQYSSPEQIAGGPRGSGEASPEALEKFYRALNKPAPIDATMYTDSGRQGYVETPDDLMGHLFRNPLENVSDIGTTLGATRWFGQNAGAMPPGQMEAQRRQGRPSFPGGLRSIGKPDDFENVAGRGLREAGGIAKGIIGGGWDWVTSMFGDFSLRDPNVDPQGRALYDN